MRRLLGTFYLAVVAVGAGASMPAIGQAPAVVPVTDAVLDRPAPGDWLRWRCDHGATGFSPLDQIQTDNVHSLRLAWAWAMGPGVQEQEPIVYNGTMYLLHPNAVLQALDARTGALIWEYRRELPGEHRRHPMVLPDGAA